MAVITITATSLGEELIAGIPQLVRLTTNTPAKIFYTLDGSDPTIMSKVYVSAINMPTNSGYLRLRVLAVSGLDTGSLDVLYGTDTSALNKHRRFDAYGIGIAYDAYNVDNVPIGSYSLDNSNVANVSLEADSYLSEFDIKLSKYDIYGNPASGYFISVGYPTESDVSNTSSTFIGSSSPNNDNVFFNPKALYIVIDGRDGYEDLSVYPINRTFASTRHKVKFNGGSNLDEPQPHISGGLVRSMFNPRTGTMVSYYYDNNVGRWIKSIQNYDADIIPGIPGQDLFGHTQVVPLNLTNI